MSNETFNRLPPAFGTLLSRLLRGERRVTYEAVVTALGLPDQIAVVEMECGKREPTLTQFFQLACLLGDAPAILLVEVVAEWRAAQTERTLYTSRASDFARLFRLGYYHKPGEFPELSTSYYSVAEATHAAGKLNAQRLTADAALLDAVCVYVRLDSACLRRDKGQCEGRQP